MIQNSEAVRGVNETGSNDQASISSMSVPEYKSLGSSLLFALLQLAGHSSPTDFSPDTTTLPSPPQKKKPNIHHD